MSQDSSSSNPQNVEIVFATSPPYALLQNRTYEPVAFEIVQALEPPPEHRIDWEKYLDIAMFVSLIAIGYNVTSWVTTWSWFGVFGGLLFNAGFTPFVLSLWALITGSRMFRKENLIKTQVSGALFILGYSLQSIEDWERLSMKELMAIIGPALFEIGALFFISKFFFLGEDDEKRIERLEKELKDARRSPGMGLALSYFYNFVLPTAVNIRAEGKLFFPILRNFQSQLKK
jgi:hypothetical protein